jgi:hypothetical protein
MFWFYNDVYYLCLNFLLVYENRKDFEDMDLAKFFFQKVFKL